MTTPSPWIHPSKAKKPDRLFGVWVEAPNLVALYSKSFLKPVETIKYVDTFAICTTPSYTMETTETLGSIDGGERIWDSNDWHFTQEY